MLGSNNVVGPRIKGEVYCTKKVNNWVEVRLKVKGWGQRLQEGNTNGCNCLPQHGQ